MTQSLPRTDEWYSLDLQTPDDTGVFDCELRLPMRSDPHRMVFVAARRLPARDRFPPKWRVFNPPESSTKTRLIDAADAKIWRPREPKSFDRPKGKKQRY